MREYLLKVGSLIAKKVEKTTVLARLRNDQIFSLKTTRSALTGETMVTRSQLPLIKGHLKNTVQLRFLSPKDDHLLDVAINYFEQFVGFSPNDITKEEFLSIIEDYKVALLLFETLKINF
jgi:hypothetical protein